MSADVFISYAAKDRERVALLVEGLQQAGVSVWIDMDGIEVAAMWSREIVSAFASARCCCFPSPRIPPSPKMWSRNWHWPASARNRSSPSTSMPAEIPETMEYQLAGIQRVEFFEGREDLALQAVIRAPVQAGRDRGGRGQRSSSRSLKYRSARRGPLFRQSRNQG